ncbi:MAG: DUF456 family protein [Neisseria sp.]|nr:DUF456 family protein [Neisseria sp.]
MTALLIVLALAMFVVGIIGLINPALPGLPLMFGAVWVLAYSGDYQVIGSGTLIVLGVITAIGMAMDFVAGLLGAKFTGASKTALWGAFLGGIIGIFFFIPGMILGPLIGAALGELSERKDLWKAGKVGVGTFIGFIVGVAAKVGCALSLIIVVVVMYAKHGLGLLF